MPNVIYYLKRLTLSKYTVLFGKILCYEQCTFFHLSSLQHVIVLFLPVTNQVVDVFLKNNLHVSLISKCMFLSSLYVFCIDLVRFRDFIRHIRIPWVLGDMIYLFNYFFPEQFTFQNPQKSKNRKRKRKLTKTKKAKRIKEKTGTRTKTKADKGQYLFSFILHLNTTLFAVIIFYAPNISYQQLNEHHSFLTSTHFEFRLVLFYTPNPYSYNISCSMRN